MLFRDRLRLQIRLQHGRKRISNNKQKLVLDWIPATSPFANQFTRIVMGDSLNLLPQWSEVGIFAGALLFNPSQDIPKLGIPVDVRRTAERIHRPVSTGD